MNRDLALVFPSRVSVSDSRSKARDDLIASPRNREIIVDPYARWNRKSVVKFPSDERSFEISIARARVSRVRSNLPLSFCLPSLSRASCSHRDRKAGEGKNLQAVTCL